MHIPDMSTADGLAGSPSATFPQKLFTMLQLNIDEGEIIHWLPHGLAFKVVDNEKFSEEVLPKYFKHTKLTSFQRQLNLYGFRRITKGDDHGAYFHPNFQRGRKDLVSNIRRLPVKTSHNSSSSDNFALDGDSSGSYSGIESSLVDLELMDDFDQPPKKKPTIILRKHSCGDAPYFFPSFLSNPTDTPSEQQTQVKIAPFEIEVHPTSSSPLFMKRAIESMPPMSKLSMNIGYARHLASTPSRVPAEKQPYLGSGQAVLESSHYPSFNLLSKSQSGSTTASTSIDSTNPLSSQHGYYAGMREAQRQPACQDYPMQSNQLTSMYACNKNSSSISDFKLLMVQTSPNDFSNGNDGSIWQPKLKSCSSSSSCLTSASSVNVSQSTSYDDIDSFDYDDIPSFDEAMDMMAARIL